MLKKYLIGGAIGALALLAFPVVAGADTIPYCGTCHAVFNDSAQTVTLTIPSGNGRWLLFVDEPDVTGQPVVGSSAAPVGANGSYTLTVDYPTCWKGTIQGDSEVWNTDKGVWHYVVGFKHAVDTTLSCPGASPALPRPRPAVNDYHDGRGDDHYGRPLHHHHPDVDHHDHPTEAGDPRCPPENSSCASCYASITRTGRSDAAGVSLHPRCSAPIHRIQRCALPAGGRKSRCTWIVDRMGGRP